MLFSEAILSWVLYIHMSKESKYNHFGFHNGLPLISRQSII